MATLCIAPDCPQPQNPDDRDRCQGCQAKLLLGQRFRPVRQLGQGGFGRTFLAWDEAHIPPQRCVIKQIWHSQGSRDRDWQEADQLVRLGRHPQIPSLIAVLESPRDICLIQTYVPGQNLEQTLAANGPASEAQVRSLLFSLLPVLQFIHDQGIIHRDIKPENILLPGNNLPPVLVDFGAARRVPTSSQLEHTGTIIGSAAYAAPEQALGKAIPASDLYSLGVTCLHLLTGQHPFDLYSVTEDRWVWQPYASHTVSPAFSRILDRLTCRALRSRYPTASAALADLAPAGIFPTPARLPPATALNPLKPKPWRCIQTWNTPGRIANAIAVSPNGLAIATANSDNTVQLWDRQTGELLHTFSRRLGWGDGHTDAVTAIQFHPKGQSLFTASQDGTLKWWDLQRYCLLQTLRQAGWPITALALTDDGQTLITATTDGHLTIWTLPQGQPLFDLVRHQGMVSDLALSSDGTCLVSVGQAGTLRLWQLPSGQLLHTWTMAESAFSAVVLSAADPCLITGNSQGQVMVWSLNDFQQHYSLDQHQDKVSTIALSPNGQLLASGSRDREIHLWNWGSEAKHHLAVLKHSWAVCYLVFTPDSRTLISSAADETIQFWQEIE